MARIMDTSQVPPQIEQALRDAEMSCSGSGGGGVESDRQRSLECINTMDEGRWELHTFGETEQVHVVNAFARYVTHGPRRRHCRRSGL